MSFAEHLLDSYDALEKKTAVSISGLKGLSSFMKHMGEVLKKCSIEAQGVCSKYKTKENSNLEGSIKAAIIALITEIESTIVGPFGSLSTEFDRSVKEYENFIKEREQLRKKLLSDTAHIQKEWESAQSALKKAKEAYFKCAKDAAAAQAACEKAQEKNAAAAKAKADSAADKARAADDSYGATLVRTNDYQRNYYTETQPELLNRFQQWENERIEFVRSQLVTVTEKIIAQDLQSKWEHLATDVKECSDAIDTEQDLEAYAVSISGKVSVPEDMPYEAAPVGPSNGGPESLSTGGGSSSYGGGGSARPQPARQPVHASAPAPAPVAHATATVTEPEYEEEGDGDDGDGEGEGERHRALFDYEAANDGELSLKEGEFVTITEKDPSGWWFAIAEDGRDGFVPSSYVEPA